MTKLTDSTIQSLSLLLAVAAISTTAGAEQSASHMPRQIEYILEDNCWSCHDESLHKGDVILDNLHELPIGERLGLMDRIQAQVFLQQMPPPDEKHQLTDEERQTLLAWLSLELGKHDASSLQDKLRYPDYGNAVDHEQLFGGALDAKASTPARRWLVSPQIFHERVLDVFELEGSERNTKLFGVTNPFVLPEKSGVRYYDNDILNGGHLLQMMTNADWIARKQVRQARIKSGEIRADEFEDMRDRWTPRKSTPEFEAVVLKDGEPSVEEMSAAIQKQFALVLRRQPSEAELAKYLRLMNEAVRIGGKTEGLRQMLVAVLLESEFLYRMEFGAGEPDQYGRVMLSPREAAYAISYAIGDRGPDELLLKAAAEGKLNSREDYRREVTRLLEDKTYYYGMVDPVFNTGKSKSPRTSHPKINRFFRDFFGYPTAVKVFKDPERSNGYYRNPGRGTLATPGHLVNEADRFIELHLSKDQNVFEAILTSNDYFVYHDLSNEEGEAVIRNWREVYEKLRNTDWKNNPQQVLVDNYDLLVSLKLYKRSKDLEKTKANDAAALVSYMQFFDEYFSKGKTPFTTVPWAHAYAFNHSPFYNLPPTPSIYRYGNSRTDKLQKLDSMELWDYPTKQPFKVENRMGILTHPAWLIAHSTNFHADAIRRGRWIREKLLAGRVPDVPITVDAQVPEDAHRTFRDRVVDVTSPKECWKCHQHMNPLGLSFEMYDDFGRYRVEEFLEHEENLIKKGNGKTTFNVYKTLPIDTTGELSGTGNPELDGKVENAFDLIRRVAKSERARQSIIRHAFRFYMGRNEQLSDSQTLIDADKAYVESGGSFRAVIISLLTSDSFIYRHSTKS